MKLAFFGSDPFSVPSLRALAAAGHELPLVVTNPDRRRGRSKQLLPTPVKELGLELGAEVLTPAGKPGPEVAEAIAGAGVELGVVVAYGQIIGRRVRRAPSLGYSINVHGSLLPRWRGAAPVAAALLAGDPVTGVSVQRIAAKVDAGKVLLSNETRVEPEDDRGRLRERIAHLGAEALVEAVARIAAGEAEFEAQDEALVTHAHLLSKEDGRLELDRPAAELARRVRAVTPWPAAFVELEQGRLQVLAARPAAGLGDGAGAPGTLFELGDPGVTVATGRGGLELLEVKPPGKKAMPARAWANGQRLKTGDVLAWTSAARG